MDKGDIPPLIPMNTWTPIYLLDTCITYPKIYNIHESIKGI